MAKRTYADWEKSEARQKERQFGSELDLVFTPFQRDYRASGLTFTQYFNAILRDPDGLTKAQLAEGGRELKKLFRGVHKARRVLGDDAHPLLKEVAAKFRGTTDQEFKKFKPVFKKILELENLDQELWFDRQMAAYQNERQERIRQRLAMRP